MHNDNVHAFERRHPRQRSECSSIDADCADADRSGTDTNVVRLPSASERKARRSRAMLDVTDLDRLLSEILGLQ